MAQIISDNQATGKTLKKLVSLVVKHGGWIADDVVLRCADGNLSVHADPVTTSPDPILMLPAECLIPTELFELGLSRNQLSIISHAAELSDQRLDLLEVMIELFNQTEKVAAHINTSPWTISQALPEIFQLIIGGRNTNVYKELLDYIDGNDNHEQLIIRSLLKTRTIGFTNDLDSNERTQMLMPIVDLVNHHPHAPTYTNYVDHNRQSQLTIKRFFANSRDHECFIRYGYYDIVDLFLIYGYVDRNTFFVRSLPMEINLPELGKIRVHSTCYHPPRKNLPPAIADLEVYLPNVTVDPEPGYSETSFLLIPQGNAPYALRRVLNIILKHMAPSLTQEQADLLIETAENQVLSENKRFYQRLLNELSTLDSTMQTHYGQQLESIAEVANLQLAKLATYPFA